MDGVDGVGVVAIDLVEWAERRQRLLHGVCACGHAMKLHKWYEGMPPGTVMCVGVPTGPLGGMERGREAGPKACWCMEGVLVLVASDMRSFRASAASASPLHPLTAGLMKMEARGGKVVEWVGGGGGPVCSLCGGRVGVAMRYEPRRRQRRSVWACDGCVGGESGWAGTGA